MVQYFLFITTVLSLCGCFVGGQVSPASSQSAPVEQQVVTPAQEEVDFKDEFYTQFVDGSSAQQAQARAVFQEIKQQLADKASQSEILQAIKQEVNGPQLAFLEQKLAEFFDKNQFTIDREEEAADGFLN